MQKILFLYTEIAEYFLACSRNLVEIGFEVHVIRYPVNKEAPFRFNEEDKLKIYNRNDYEGDNLSVLVLSIKPDLIVCSGWIDKGYLGICKKYYKKIPTVLTLDNHWHGNFKQRIATFFSPIYLLNRFSHCWVPGNKQKEYALKLGFKSNKISTGFYCANTAFFQPLYKKYLAKKQSNFPKRFLYVGRYYDFKGLTELWDAFIELQIEYPNDWELWCLGTGTLKPIEHPKIKHFGFVQPNELEKYIADTGVFLLPSRFEPWAVVVHEFACAGFPLLCSDAVGAAELFLEEGKNGFGFKKQDIHSLKQAIRKMVDLPNDELLKMCEASAVISNKINLDKWAKTLNEFL